MPVKPVKPVKIDKRVVRRSFSRAAGSYDSYSGLQRYSARMLVELLPSGFTPSSLLDIGSGTGELLGLLAGRFPASPATVTAMDISLEMLKRSRNKAHKTSPHFVAGECNHLPFHDKSFDLIISGLTYQWVTALDGAFAEAFRATRPGGFFLLTVMSEGTLKELGESFKTSGADTELMDFLSVSSLKRTVRGAGFDLLHSYEENLQREYADLFGLLRVLRGIGASMHRSAGDRGLGRGFRIKAAAPVYRELYPARGSSGIRATYNIAYLLLRRPAGPARS